MDDREATRAELLGALVPPLGRIVRYVVADVVLTVVTFGTVMIWPIYDRASTVLFGCAAATTGGAWTVTIMFALLRRQGRETVDQIMTASESGEAAHR